MFYGGCLKMCEDVTPNFCGKGTGWLLHHDNTSSHTSFYIMECFTKSNMTVILLA
jgi:hypothetical protein